MITVLGSINLDMTTYVDVRPKMGETVYGTDYAQFPGGKGANQAAAMAKLGTEVTFLGKVGTDAPGDYMLAALKDSGVNTSYIAREEGPTGIAQITVESSGQNVIVIVAGANGKVDRSYAAAHESVICQSEVLVAQHEIPMETTLYAFERARAHGVMTVLNPAPARALLEELIAVTDVLVPNEFELGLIAGEDTGDMDGIYRAAHKLLDRGVKMLIVTLGSRGVLYMDAQTKQLYPANKVTAVDTTAAGDTFIGGFLSSYVTDKNIEKAIAYGQKAAAYVIGRRGAQSAMPCAGDI